MKKSWMLLAFLFAALGLGAQEKLTFAVLSDTHIGSFAYAVDDLNEAIDDINANPDIEFVVVSGDITEFGTDQEILQVRDMLARLKKKYLFIPGNHDTNWSESGCTMFNKVMGGSQFRYMHDGVLFLGISTGPYMRMGPAQAPREDIEWLKKNLEETDIHTPVVFVAHAPLTVGDLANYDEIIDLIKTRNVRFVINGHYHGNRLMDYEGVPGAIVRSSLRRQDPCGGYTVVTMDADTVTFSERRPCEDALRAPWGKFAMRTYSPRDTVRADRRNFTAENAAHSKASVKWMVQDVSDIASGTAYENGVIYFTNTLGQVKAIRKKDGKAVWDFQTGEKIFSEPVLRDGRLYVSSADGSVYCLNAKNGKQIWQFRTDYPILSTPLVTDDGYLYVGGANGKFYALEAATGKEVWVYQGIKGYTEAKPAVWKDLVFIGSWGAEFYALNRKTGELAWKYAPGISRYLSPGGCWPVVHGDRLFVQSADRFLYCFNAADGRIVWSTKDARGRESIGLSPDGKTLYVKTTKDDVIAVDTEKDVYSPLWTAHCGFGGDYAPTRIVPSGDRIFVATATGKVYCLDKSGEVLWHHKFSNTLITSVRPVGADELIVTTMDGKIFLMGY